ncbi:MAG TPA: hypothetical protein VGB83_01425 [Actinomycetota bacterium]
MDDTQSPEPGTFSPPYNIPWGTFLSTIEKVAEDLPNKIDRSYLGTRSGNEQTYLIAAFKGFRLIYDDGRVSDELRELAADADARPGRIADLLRRCYPDATKLGETNATMGELEEAFSQAYPRITGASRTKAIRFYLAASDYASVPKSPLWKVAKKAPSAGGGKRGGRRGTKVDPVPREVPARASNHRHRYLDMLLKKAEGADELDESLLNRIEKLLGEPTTEGGNS